MCAQSLDQYWKVPNLLTQKEPVIKSECKLKKNSDFSLDAATFELCPFINNYSAHNLDHAIILCQILPLKSMPVLASFFW